jgi:hypothetical protein
MRIRRLTIVIASTLAVLMLLDLALTAFHVRRFRQLPSHESAMFLFAFESPGRILGRHLIFRPGSAIYHSELRSMLYDKNIVDDWPWNRKLLETDALTLAGPDLFYLSSYPWPFDAAMYPVIDRAVAAHEYSAFSLCPRFTDAKSRTSCRQLAVSLIERSDLAEIVRLAPYALQFPEAVDGTLTRLDTWLDAQPKDDLEQWYEFFSNLQFVWQEPPETSSTVFEWIIRRFGRTQTHLDEYDAEFLSTLRASPSQMLDALRLIEISESDLADRVGHKLLAGTTGTDTMKLWLLASQDPGLASDGHALIAYHHLLHVDAQLANQVAEPVVAGPDSMLRKGTIVLLVRHDQFLGYDHIDDVFSGAAPRRTFFPQSSMFFGSAAYAEYTRLSGHDYNETGKKWPPAGNQATDGWREFITGYPWFPGADDAYYRLAYGLLATRNWDESIELCLEFMRRREWPDRDAAPYVFQVLRSALINRPDTSGLSEPLVALRQLLQTPLVIAVLDDQDFRKFRDAVAALRGKSRWIDVLGLEEGEFERLETLVGKLRAADSKAQRLNVLLETTVALEPYSRRGLLFHDRPDMGPVGSTIRGSDSLERFATMAIDAVGRNAGNVGSTTEPTAIGLLAVLLWEDLELRQIAVLQPLFATLRHIDETRIRESWHDVLASMKASVGGGSVENF